ncbi:hypothetical protein Tco_0011820 [Tanacetum coccineum]
MLRMIVSLLVMLKDKYVGKKCSSQEVSKFISRLKDQDIKIKSQDIDTKIKFQDHKLAEGSNNRNSKNTRTPRFQDVQEVKASKVHMTTLKGDSLWIVDTTIPVLYMAVLSSSRLCGESDLTMTKLRTSVLAKGLSPIVISRVTSSSGQECSLKKPTSGTFKSTLSDLIEGFNIRKQCA